jgi:two-component system cell cycle sensor histidine kinase/response regulator CckA
MISNHETIADLKSVIDSRIGYYTDHSDEDSDSVLRQYQMMETLGRMALSVAHDFNHLLTVIRGYSDLALLEMSPQHSLRDYLMEINKAAMQATLLTKRILLFGQKETPKAVVVEIPALVEDMHGMLRNLLGKEIQLVCIYAPGLGRVSLAPGQLEQVIMNLVVNARDAMPRGGRVSIVVENATLRDDLVDIHGVVPSGSYVRLAVTDSGLGMDEATLARIFQPYFTTKPLNQGTGLGLSIVREVVEQSGGYLLVKSEVNKGASFTLYFPRVSGALAALHPEISVA